MNITISILVAYMMIIVLISVLSSKISKRVKNNTPIGFLLAGKSLSWQLIAVMICGYAVGGSSTIGVAQSAFGHGMSAAWYTVSFAAGILTFLFMVKRVRQMAASTVSGIFLKLFGKKSALAIVLMQVVILTGTLAAQVVAGGSIISAIVPSISLPWALVISAVIFFAVSFFGGYFGASVSNLINVVVVYLGLILVLVLGVNHFGGTDAVALSLPEGNNWFDLFSGIGPVLIAGWFLTMIAAFPTTQPMFQATVSARNRHHARVGICVAAALSVPVGFICAYIGVMAVSEFPSIESALALPTVVVSFGPVLAGICLAGLWAADVSTAVGGLCGLSSIVVNDIVLQHIKPNASDKWQVFISKTVIVLSSIIALLIAENLSSLISFIVSLSSALTPFSLMLMLALFAPTLLRRSTFAAVIACGCGAMALYTFIPACRIVPQIIWLVLPVSIGAWLLTLVFDRRKVYLLPKTNNK